MDKAVLFTNWTDEDFVGMWNNEPYLLAKKTSRFYPEYLATHFAKHLTDREMNKAKVTTDHFSRKEYLDKCFTEVIEASSAAAVNDLILNQPKQEEKVVEEPKAAALIVEESTDVSVVEKKKLGRPKKEVKEEEFAGLKD